MGATMIDEFWAGVAIVAILILIQHIIGHAVILRSRGVAFASKSKDPAAFKLGLYLYWLILGIYVSLHFLL